MSTDGSRFEGRPALFRGLAGAIGGALTGTFFSLWALVLWTRNGGNFGTNPITLGRLVAIYLGWGIGVGTSLGVAFPLARTRIGSVVAGAGVMVSGYLLVGLSMNESRNTMTLVLVLGAIIGGTFGHRLLGSGKRT